MPAPRLSAVFQTSPAPPVADPRPDAVMPARFPAHAYEAAFAALIARHTPAVRDVSPEWVRATAAAAKGLLAGTPPAALGCRIGPSRCPKEW